MVHKFISPALASPQSSRLIYPNLYSAFSLRHTFPSLTFHAPAKTLYSPLSDPLNAPSPISHLNKVSPSSSGQNSRLRLFLSFSHCPDQIS